MLTPANPSRQHAGWVQASSTAHVRVFIRYGLAPVFSLAVLLAFLNYASGTRLPTACYLVFGILQLAVVLIQVHRWNLLTAMVGCCLTAILLIAAMIERAPFLDFDGALPARYYTPDLISHAYSVLLFTSAAYHLLTLWCAPPGTWRWQPADATEKFLARRMTWVLLFLGTIATVLTITGSPITEAAYATPEFERGMGLATKISGLALLGTYFLVCSLVACIRGRGYGTTAYRMVVILVLAVTFEFRILRGDRGSSLGVLVTVAFLFYINSRKSTYAKNILLVGTAVALFGLLGLWASVRSSAADMGLVPALQSGWAAAFPDLSHPLEINMLPQSYWHLLETISLHQSGLSLNGRTFIDLVKQSVPSFIADALHYQRPLNSAWLLGRFGVPGGGGMFIIAEGYWNFGFWGAALIAGALAFMAVKLEKWYRSQPPLMSCTYFAFLGTLGFGVFYGLQPLVKALEIALVLTVAMKIVLSWQRRAPDLKRRLTRVTRPWPVSKTNNAPNLRTENI